MRYSILTVCLAAALALGCSREAATPADGAAPPAAAKTETAVTSPAVVDAHSYAQPDKVRIDDLALQLAVDFEHKQLSGSATYTLNWVDKAATQLVLDTRGLNIEKIVGERSDGKWDDLKFALAPADKLFGSKLTIETPERNARVRVTYKTSPDASGLQWLTPAMTEGKKTPFMFSQSQQIHARSWVPLQDTPSVRFTYTAHVTAPKDAMVLMSADNDPKAARDGDYEFKMPQKIPSYLLAIAAGDLVFQPISQRSGVWAEPAMAPKAVAEFSDTEKMMETAEKLYGPYRWDRYDILVLPPSFPYGGMENPRLTFATPTAIVGDKSLVSLIAHELAHSWSGNLVTFSTSNDAWLNEGFTSYVENRIVEVLYGKERADMESLISRNELRSEFTDANKPLQALAIKPGALDDPDNNLTGTVYTKGAWFLQFLEQRFGRDNFDAFLRGYFDHFAFQSISTQQFVDYAKANLLDKYPGKVTQAEFDAWLYEPGIPSNAPQTPSARFDAIDAARKAWLDAGTLPDKAATAKWSTQEWVHFVEGMPDTLSVDQLKALDAAYKLTGTPNGEIAQRWYPLTVRSGYTQADAAIAAFLQRIGRRKLIMPTYSELVKTPAGLKLAEDTFAKAKPGYHPITTESVEAVIAKAKAAPQAAK
ncbi:MULTISPECIES: M1 family metallopeptidase [unclassified Lysobacter]|uniref:M1 family metallopeptidase n=1 Tax=unclassified Lysobacter TaxID=2635362 RepID=UPI00070A2D28|nr:MULTISPECIES: M1 family metallopeptidase [unclassified Lysobacter]KRD34772.1 aminopeptidase [Lysobacter sp. Root916]KRD77151.1 aminopeptidase [Lysobacter sp. Root983]